METNGSDFGNLLKHWMNLRDINDADLARLVFGTMIDERGYEVAKNRQLIGRYKVGKVIPKPSTQKAILLALGLSKEEFYQLVPNGKADCTPNGKSSEYFRSISKIYISDGPQEGTKAIEVSAVLDEPAARQIMSILLSGEAEQ